MNATEEKRDDADTDPYAVKRSMMELLTETLFEPADTAGERWKTYWMARVLLRQIAMESFDTVVMTHFETGEAMDDPSEVFKEIAADVTPSMRAAHPTVEEPDRTAFPWNNAE